MNTVTRDAIVARHLRRRSHTFQVTKQGIVVILLVITLLCSAFGVVYIKDLNRRLFIQYQMFQREGGKELIRWGRLLLEQSTWSTQSRIQQVARQQLGMQIPTAKEVILINKI